MKSTLLAFFLIGVVMLATLAAQAPPQIAGTWSGNWTPKGGVQDAVSFRLFLTSDSRTLCAAEYSAR